MRVGIFAGGFKPFHVGHFSRLCQAVSSCDKTYVFYGVSSRQKGSQFRFTENNASHVFDITKRAIEKQYGDRVEIIKSVNPVTSVYETIIDNHDSENTVSVFGRDSDLSRYYKTHIGTRKEQKYFGNMLSENRLSFIDSIDPDVVLDYFPNKERGQIINLMCLSGSQFRKNIENAKINDLFDMLPPILSLSDKVEIFRDLGIDIPKPATVNHILHPYEMLDMTINDLHDLINDVANFNVQDVQEKMDGQNLTFTFYDGEIRFLTKGPDITRLISSSKSRDQIKIDYSHKPYIRDAFIWAMDLLEPAVLKNSHLFRDGLIVVEAALLYHTSSNTIAYEDDQVRLICPNSVVGGVHHDDEGFKQFFKDLEDETKGLVSMVPAIESTKDCDQSFLHSLHSQLTKIAPKHCVTICDVFVQRAIGYISRETSLEASLITPAALRLVTGNKGYLTVKLCNQQGPEQWKEYKKLENNKSLHMMRIREPIEDLLVRLHHDIQSRISLQLTCSNIAEIDDIAYQALHDVSDESELECLMFIQDRFDMLDYTEGIVFTWRDRLLKLTGHFTRLNKAKWIAHKRSV